jgi:hypothetical protein
MSLEDIVDVYLSHVPAFGMLNSCINHADTGCALPREWRSDICNAFFCPEVTRYEETRKKAGVLSRTVVVQRDYNLWNRYALDQDTQVLSITSFNEDGTEAESLAIEDFFKD